MSEGGMGRADSTRRQTPTFQRPISRPVSSRAFSGIGPRTFPAAAHRALRRACCAWPLVALREMNSGPCFAVATA